MNKTTALMYIILLMLAMAWFCLQLMWALGVPRVTTMILAPILGVGSVVAAKMIVDHYYF